MHRRRSEYVFVPSSYLSANMGHPVCVCLLVLFMQKRDERRARSLQSSGSEVEPSEDLELEPEVDDDLDSKTSVSVVERSAVDR